MSWARAFRIMRAAAGLTQTELAERMKITSSHLSLIERGKRCPSMKTAASLARALRTDQVVVTAFAAVPEFYNTAKGNACAGLLRSLLSIKDRHD